LSRQSGKLSSESNFVLTAHFSIAEVCANQPDINATRPHPGPKRRFFLVLRLTIPGKIFYPKSSTDLPMASDIVRTAELETTRYLATRRRFMNLQFPPFWIKFRKYRHQCSPTCNTLALDAFMLVKQPGAFNFKIDLALANRAATAMNLSQVMLAILPAACVSTRIQFYVLCHQT
jgi:hypothetical protein